jgi:hypothetical protein
MPPAARYVPPVPRAPRAGVADATPDTPANPNVARTWRRWNRCDGFLPTHGQNRSNFLVELTNLALRHIGRFCLQSPKKG